MQGENKKKLFFNQIILKLLATMDLDKFQKRTNISVNDLASKVGVKPAAIYNYKYGKSKPSYDVVEKLLLLGATIGEVFSDDVEACVAKAVPTSSPSAEDYAEIVRKGLLELAKRNQG